MFWYHTYAFFGLGILPVPRNNLVTWSMIDGPVTLEQVCYGDGLQALVGRMQNLPKIPLAPNILEGLEYKVGK